MAKGFVSERRIFDVQEELAERSPSYEDVVAALEDVHEELVAHVISYKGAWEKGTPCPVCGGEAYSVRHQNHCLLVGAERCVTWIQQALAE